MRETIGHYRILDQIGTGVIGDLYRARDTKVGRTVAIRVLNDAIARDPGRRRRFLEDARAAAAVSHPNIAALYEVGESPDLLYLVSEFVPGDTLRTIVGGRPINPRRAIDLAAQVADALAQAHAQGMAHGDLRPENIIVTPKGSVKIMEPGFAAWAGEVPDPGSTTGFDVGFDIAALGAVLFEMLTGTAPFASAPAGAGRPHGRLAPPAPTSVNLALPAEVDPILARMLAENPEDRFASAAVLAAELRSLGAVLGARREPGQHPGTRVTRAGRPWLVWVFAVLVLGAIGALIWLATRAS